MRERATLGSTNRNKGLDYLRAIACLCVVIQHASAWRTVPGGWAYGSYGVCLFCVLSGYLITHLLLVEEMKKHSIDINEFLLRRALRIIPPYFLMLATWTSILKFGLYFKSRPDLVTHFLENLPAFATFTHNWSGNLGDLGHLWSISVEEQYYICIPIFLVVLRSWHLRVMALFFAVLFCWFFTVRDPLLTSFVNSAFLPLIMGSLLAVTWEQLDKLLGRYTSASFNLSASAFLLIVSICGGLNPYGPISSLSFVVLVRWIALTSPDSPKLDWLAYIGRVSYGIYVYHATIILLTSGILGIFNRRLQEHFFVALVILVCIAVSALSFECFEKPILKTLRTFRLRPIGVTIAYLSPTLIFIGLARKVYHYFY